MARNAEGDAGSEVAAFQATGNSLPGSCSCFGTLDPLALQAYQSRHRNPVDDDDHL